MDCSSLLAEYDAKIKKVNTEIEEAESECAKAAELDDSRLFDEMYFYHNTKLDDLEKLIQERDSVYQHFLKETN